MGAFIVAGIIALVTFCFAAASELARGMASNPSNHKSRFFLILVPGWVLAALVALTHWLPSIGW